MVRRGRKLGPPVRPEDSPVIFAAVVLGETSLYKWQMLALERAARGKRIALRAANGSGKTDKVIGILALWFLWRYPRGRMPITSGSWRQVKNQLWPALERHRNNPSLAGWKWLKNCRVETPEGGFIEGFSTNHAGKAEGWHGRVTDEFKDERKEPEEEDPRSEKKARLFDADEFTGDDPSSPVFFVVDEAKTVPDEIFDAIERCTLQFCIYLSSPGKPSGQFFRCFHEEKDLFCPMVVTAFDCPHISQERIDRILARVGGNEEDSYYRSVVLAEFTVDGDLYIIDPGKLEYGQRQSYEPRRGRPVAFLDIAAGGDETVLAICDGNEVWIEYAERRRDTVQSVRKCIATLKELGIADCDLWVDAPGMGLAVINDFHEMGWYPNEFFGNNPPEDKDRYINLAAECWNDAGLELITGRVHIKAKHADTVLFTQLTTRYKEYADDSKIRNEKKEKMKSRGIHSPDRADALLGAIWTSIRGAAGVWTGEGNKPVVGKSQHAVRHTGKFCPI